MEKLVNDKYGLPSTKTIVNPISKILNDFWNKRCIHEKIPKYDAHQDKFCSILYSNKKIRPSFRSNFQVRSNRFINKSLIKSSQLELISNIRSQAKYRRSEIPSTFAENKIEPINLPNISHVRELDSFIYDNNKERDDSEKYENLYKKLEEKWNYFKIPETHKNYIIEGLDQANDIKEKNRILKTEIKLLVQKKAQIYKLQKKIDKRNVIYQKLINLLQLTFKKNFIAEINFVNKIIKLIQKLRNLTYECGCEVKNWRVYLKEILGRVNSEFVFEIGRENYIQVFFNDYVKLFKSNLPSIINMSKKFDPLFLNPAIINGNRTIFKF